MLLRLARRQLGRQVGADGDLALAVVALDAAGAGGHLDVGDIAQAHRLPSSSPCPSDMPTNRFATSLTLVRSNSRNCTRMSYSSPASRYLLLVSPAKAVRRAPAIFGDGQAAVGGAQAVDAGVDLRPSGLGGDVHVEEPGNLLAARATSCAAAWSRRLASSLSTLYSRSAPPGPPMPLAGVTLIVAPGMSAKSLRRSAGQ